MNGAGAPLARPAGAPRGDRGFVAALEALTGRLLDRREPGPRGPRASN
jgi:hypothetical protein